MSPLPAGLHCLDSRKENLFAMSTCQVTKLHIPAEVVTTYQGTPPGEDHRSPPAAKQNARLFANQAVRQQRRTRRHNNADSCPCDV